MVLQLLIMSAVLAAACYGVGTLPLSFSFSSMFPHDIRRKRIFTSFLESHLQRLSVLGTGLLLGAALGVIIPEYILPLWWRFMAHGNPIEALKRL